MRICQFGLPQNLPYLFTPANRRKRRAARTSSSQRCRPPGCRPRRRNRSQGAGRLKFRLQAIEDEAERERVTAELREEYAADINLLHLASELIIDAIVEPEDLRDELVKRFALASRRRRERSPRRGSVRPI